VWLAPHGVERHVPGLKLVLLADGDDRRVPVGPGERLDHDLPERRVRDEEVRAGVVELVGELADLVLRVDGGDDDAGAERPERGDDVLRAVRQVEQEPVAGAEPPVAQPPRERLARRPELLVGGLVAGGLDGGRVAVVSCGLVEQHRDVAGPHPLGHVLEVHATRYRGPGVKRFSPDDPPEGSRTAVLSPRRGRGSPW
jgi:hypothetical protein